MLVLIRNTRQFNDALAAVRLMDRPNSERVTINVDPGDYQEMLVN